MDAAIINKISSCTVATTAAHADMDIPLKALSIAFNRSYYNGLYT